MSLEFEKLSEYKQMLHRILCDGKYDVIHVHENETNFIVLSAAKKEKISVQIAHSHMAYSINDI